VQPWCHEVDLNEGRSMSKVVAVPLSIQLSSFGRIRFSYRAGLDVTVIDRQPNHSPTPPSVCPDQVSYILEMGRYYNDHGTVSHASHLYPTSRSHIGIRRKFPLLSPLHSAWPIGAPFIQTFRIVYRILASFLTMTILFLFA
jgi:hypothetical protein